MNTGRFVAVWIFVLILAVVAFGAFSFFAKGELVLFAVCCWGFVGVGYIAVALARGEFDP